MGNLLILKDVDFSAVAVERLNYELFRQNYDESSPRTVAFNFRAGGANIAGLHPASVSLAGKTVVGVKISILNGYSYTGDLILKIYKFNASEHIEIGSVPMEQCAGKEEVIISTKETLFDGNYMLGIGNAVMPTYSTQMPFTGELTGGSTKVLRADCSAYDDIDFKIFNAIYVKAE